MWSVAIEFVGEERFHMLGQARALLLTSRFENCSMTVLDSLVAGTVVVAWDVGGHAEIAPPPLICLVPFENYELMATELERVRTEPYPSEARFEAAIEALVRDFERGFQAIREELIDGRARHRPYEGLNRRRDSAVL